MPRKQDRPDTVVSLIRDIVSRRDQTCHTGLLMICAGIAIFIAITGPALAVQLVFGNQGAAAVLGGLSAVSTVSAVVAARRATLARRAAEEPPPPEE